MEQQADVQLIAKIAAIAKVNQEISDRIPWKELAYESIYSISKNNGYQYQYKPETITLISRSGPAVDLLQFCQPIEDYFNDKLDYQVRQASDLSRLNKSMLPIAKKYELFGPTPKALAVLQKFKDNFEAIQVALGKIEDYWRGSYARYTELANKVKALNERYEQLKQLQTQLNQDIDALQSELVAQNNTSEKKTAKYKDKQVSKNETSEKKIKDEQKHETIVHEKKRKECYKNRDSSDEESY